MDKKGEGEQFNWLFVIIAGAIILSFFTVFTFKYIGLQQERQDAQMARALGENLELLQASEGDLAKDDSEFKLPFTTGVDFHCEESLLTINNKFSQSISNEVVFASSSLTINGLDAWISAWKYPYYIVNTIYLSDPKQNYYFIYDSSSKDFVTSLDIPPIFNFVKQDQKIPLLQDKKKKATLIYFTKPSKEELEKDFTLFSQTTILSVDLTKNEITFYTQSGETKEHYYGQALLNGAFFSTSAENYHCALQKALQRSKRINELYTTKLLLYQNLGKPECNYQALQSSLNKPLSDETAKELSEQNQELGGKGCPTLF